MYDAPSCLTAQYPKWANFAADGGYSPRPSGPQDICLPHTTFSLGPKTYISLPQVPLTFAGVYVNRKGEAMAAAGTVAELAEEVLVRQARYRAEETGELLEEAIRAVVNTTAGRMLAKLADGPYGDLSPEEWQARIAEQREEDYRDRRMICETLQSRVQQNQPTAGAA